VSREPVFLPTANGLRLTIRENPLPNQREPHSSSSILPRHLFTIHLFPSSSISGNRALQSNNPADELSSKAEQLIRHP